MTESDKIRENKLRRMAQRQGLALKKSPRRDTHALGYGTYMLIKPAASNAIVASSLPDGYGLTLDEVERELTGEGQS